ncbi:MAG: peptidylprolyl isomerase [Methanomassiliicoccales archaeon]
MVSKVRCSHILVKTDAEARDILLQLKSGKSFEELAKKYSTCPSKAKGGDLGEFGKGQMVKEFEVAAFNGKKGDVVGPVKTQFGYHIIKIVDQQ